MLRVLSSLGARAAPVAPLIITIVGCVVGLVYLKSNFLSEKFHREGIAVWFTCANLPSNGTKKGIIISGHNFEIPDIVHGSITSLRQWAISAVLMFNVVSKSKLNSKGYFER